MSGQSARARIASAITAPLLVRRAVVSLSVGLVVLAVAMFAAGYVTDAARIPIGLDWIGYRHGVERLLATGTPYEPFQLSGQFTPAHLDFIHPPSAVPLFLPFTILPTPFDYVAFMAIPLALTVALLVRVTWWAWPIVAVLALTANTQITYINGNSSMWLAAAFGWSLYMGWPAGLLALKPSISVLALPGLRRRPRGVLTLAVIPIALTLPFARAWLDFVVVLRNAQGLDWTYSFVQWPLFLIAALPWLSRNAQAWVERHRWTTATTHP